MCSCEARETNSREVGGSLIPKMEICTAVTNRRSPEHPMYSHFTLSPFPTPAFPMSLLARTRSLSQFSSRLRQFATAAGSSSSNSKFSQTLADGPSLDDFITGDSAEHVVLGNTKACVILPVNLYPHPEDCQSSTSFVPQDIYSFWRLVQQDQERPPWAEPSHSM
jgi:hypothetical protein